MNEPAAATGGAGRLGNGRLDAGLPSDALVRGHARTVARARGDRARGGRGRPGDEARRRLESPARRGSPRRRAVHDPARPELRHRLRSLLERDCCRDRRDGDRDRLDARLLRALRRPPSRAARRARPRDRRQRLEPRRPRPARLRHRLPRLPLLAGVQPRRQLHRDRSRDPAGRARPRRAGAAGVPAR